MAYDEIKTLENHKEFSAKAVRELLGRERSRSFIERIMSAPSVATISRVMVEVRRAI